MTRYWEPALLITLLLISVFGCAKRTLNAIPFQGAYAACKQSSLGQFQVIVTPAPNSPGYYQVSVTAYLATNPGETVRIALCNSAYCRDLTEGVVLEQNTTLFTGPMSYSDLSVYQVLGIAPTSGGQSTFMDLNSQQNEICQLPASTLTQSPLYGN